MDGETTMNGCLQDFMKDTSFNPSSKNLSFCAPTACFDCNICLEFAADPVVTLCGHLYCWPCIFRWLRLDTSPRHCPVCKSPISESSLVPLYGRGLDSKLHHRDDDADIPHRPRDHRKFASPAIASEPQPPPVQRQDLHMYQNYHFYSNDGMNHLGVLHSTAGAILGEIAFAVLPLAFRNNEDLTVSRRNQRWRQELLVKSWLHQLWLFLFCCAFLCFVVF